MILLTHILIAIGSIAQASLALLAPSRRKLQLNYVLQTLTLASGTYLVISLDAPLLSSCVSGLAYLAVANVLLAGAHYRLARQRAKM